MIILQIQGNGVKVKSQLRVLAILQARMSSTRLPGKVLKPINGQPMILRQINRINRSKMINKLVVATSVQVEDLEIVSLCERYDIASFRGSLEDVLDRYIQASKLHNYEIIVRLTADCPLFMPELCDEMISEFISTNIDYMSNRITLSYPDGLDIEIFSSEALRRLNSFSLTALEREHVTLGMYSRTREFSCRNFLSKKDLSNLRWTVDNERDLSFVRAVYDNFVGHESTFTFNEVLEFVKVNPDLSNTDRDNIRDIAIRGEFFDGP